MSLVGWFPLGTGNRDVEARRWASMLKGENIDYRRPTNFRQGGAEVQFVFRTADGQTIAGRKFPQMKLK